MGSNFKNFADKSIQPKQFFFSKENKFKAEKIKKMYPKNYLESSIMPLLSLAQEQNNGWLPKKAIEYIGLYLNVPEIKVLELATFYSMYNLSPVGDYHIEICTTSPCMLRGSDELLHHCKNKLRIGLGEVSSDKKFSLNRVECLGACVNAPVVKINENYYEDLDKNTFDNLLDNINEDKKVKTGPQSTRKGTEPFSL